MAKKTIFIAAGGTGGHLFPAIYIAQALQELDTSLTVVALGAGRPLEAKLFHDWQLEYHIIPTVGLKNRGIKGIFEFVLSLPRAVVKTASLFARYKPAAVVGVGGYVTVLPVLMAWCRAIPAWIHEAEIKPGMANAFLSFFSQKVSVAFESCELPRLIEKTFTGHPVRRGLVEVKRSVPLTEQPKHLLILGGSQGAQSLDDAAPALATFAKQHGLSLIHQCRAQNVDAVRAVYQASALTDYEVKGFVDDVIAAYAWADIIISRSGAGSVSELSVVNKPVIFVPFPYAQADHQTRNANTLVEIGKAMLCPEGPGFQERLCADLATLMDLSCYNDIVGRPQKVSHQDAAQTIAAGVLSLISD